MNTTIQSTDTWYFTFGANHLDESGDSLGNCFVAVTAPDGCEDSFSETRKLMFAARGDKFCTQYPSAEEAGASKFGLVERTLESVAFDPVRIHRDRVVCVTSREREKLTLMLAQMDTIESILMKLPASVVDKACIIGGQLDFDHLTREEVLQTIAALDAGRWEKSKNISEELALDYKSEVDGVTVRLWAAAPPGTCRVVEEEVEIPATPARTIIQRKLVCHEP